MIDVRLKSLRVSIGRRTVGLLAQTQEGVLAFEYDDEWLLDGFSISPFSLPLEKRVFVANNQPLGGVFGVFDDSLPDGWGRLLVDRLLKSHGIDPYSVGPLARLSIVGSSGMGALEYHPEANFTPWVAPIDLDEIAHECAQLLKSDYSEDLDALFMLGGSSGGARPKILTEIDGEQWIIKFPSSFDSVDIGEHEYLLACVAISCGIEMPEVQLFPSKRCAGYFGVRRFDRFCNDKSDFCKIHMVSAGALLETSHRIPNLGYELLMRMTLKLTDSMDDVERLYRLMCFNVLVGNKDDHSKNFSYLYNEKSHSWALSPAYDLTRNAGMNGQHATTVNGKGVDIEDDDLLTAALQAGLSQSKARLILEEVREAVLGLQR